MKTLLVVLIICFIIPGCGNDQSRHVMNTLDNIDAIDRTGYPVFIEGGSKLIYQFGHLTSDKGLKLYYDTIPHPSEGLILDDSLRRELSVR